VEEGEKSDTEEQQGKNVLLFSHACGLERYNIPDGTEIEVHRGFGDPDDLNHSIWICETVPASSKQEDNVSAIDTGQCQVLRLNKSSIERNRYSVRCGVITVMNPPMGL
jgi:hypothetical protein